MRKKTVLFALIFCLTTISSSYAEEVKNYHWDDKLIRGLLNIVSSPVEIGRSIHLQTEESSLLEGWTLGLVKGLGTGLLRLGAGAVDLLTFPFNFPDDEKGPLVEPEFVWDKPGVKYIS
jgi:putative exosortase-associated protein (TIGR04073 family)